MWKEMLQIQHQPFLQSPIANAVIKVTSNPVALPGLATRKAQSQCTHLDAQLSTQGQRSLIGFISTAKDANILVTTGWQLRPLKIETPGWIVTVAVPSVSTAKVHEFLAKVDISIRLASFLDPLLCPDKE